MSIDGGQDCVDGRSMTVAVRGQLRPRRRCRSSCKIAPRRTVYSRRPKTWRAHVSKVKPLFAKNEPPYRVLRQGGVDTGREQAHRARWRPPASSSSTTTGNFYLAARSPPRRVITRKNVTYRRDQQLSEIMSASRWAYMTCGGCITAVGIQRWHKIVSYFSDRICRAYFHINRMKSGTIVTGLVARS